VAEEIREVKVAFACGVVRFPESVTMATHQRISPVHKLPVSESERALRTKLDGDFLKDGASITATVSKFPRTPTTRMTPAAYFKR
jgi:hypothetical protein